MSVLSLSQSPSPDYKPPTVTVDKTGSVLISHGKDGETIQRQVTKFEGTEIQGGVTLTNDQVTKIKAMIMVMITAEEGIGQQAIDHLKDNSIQKWSIKVDNSVATEKTAHLVHESTTPKFNALAFSFKKYDQVLKELSSSTATEPDKKPTDSTDKKPEPPQQPPASSTTKPATPPDDKTKLQEPSTSQTLTPEELAKLNPKERAEYNIKNIHQYEGPPPEFLNPFRNLKFKKLEQEPHELSRTESEAYNDIEKALTNDNYNFNLTTKDGVEKFLKWNNVFDSDQLKFLDSQKDYRSLKALLNEIQAVYSQGKSPQNLQKLRLLIDKLDKHLLSSDIKKNDKRYSLYEPFSRGIQNALAPLLTDLSKIAKPEKEASAWTKFKVLVNPSGVVKPRVLNEDEAEQKADAIKMAKKNIKVLSKETPPSTTTSTNAVAKKNIGSAAQLAPDPSKSDKQPEVPLLQRFKNFFSPPMSEKELKQFNEIKDFSKVLLKDPNNPINKMNRQNYLTKYSYVDHLNYYKKIAQLLNALEKTEPLLSEDLQKIKTLLADLKASDYHKIKGTDPSYLACQTFVNELHNYINNVMPIRL